MKNYNFEYRYIAQTNDELKKELTDKYHVNEFDIEDVFTETQLSKVERRPEYMYVALQFPEYAEDNRQFLAKEIHCFITDGSLLIIDKHNFKHIQQFDDWQATNQPTNLNSFQLFYEMFDFCINKSYRVIRKFNVEINQIEVDIFNFNSRPKDLLKDIMITKRNLVNFASIIQPLQAVVEEIQQKHIKAFENGDGLEAIDDSLDKIKKMVNNLKNFKEQVDTLSQTNENIIIRNTNDVIKILTIFNLFFLVPTTITSFFGMNIYFGWKIEDSGLGPLIGICLSILFLLAGTIWLIRKKKLI